MYVYVGFTLLLMLLFCNFIFFLFNYYLRFKYLLWRELDREIVRKGYYENEMLF